MRGATKAASERSARVQTCSPEIRADISRARTGAAQIQLQYFLIARVLRRRALHAPRDPRALERRHGLAESSSVAPRHRRALARNPPHPERDLGLRQKRPKGIVEQQ